MIKVTCSNCGKRLEVPNEATGTIGNMRYASFWDRVAAYFIDAIILLFGFTFIGAIGGGIFSLGGKFLETPPGVEFFFPVLGISVAWLYYALLESSPRQATVGKMALGLKVTDLGGKKIGFGRASGRNFAKILSGLLGIGYIMVAFTDKNQGLHDIIAGCLVVKKQISPSESMNVWQKGTCDDKGTEKMPKKISVLEEKKWEAHNV